MIRICSILVSGSLMSCMSISQGGDIVGTVRAQGKPGAHQDVASGKDGSRKFKFVERVDYAALNGFVVCIDQPSAEKPPPPKEAGEVRIDFTLGITNLPQC